MSIGRAGAIAKDFRIETRAGRDAYARECKGAIRLRSNGNRTASRVGVGEVKAVLGRCESGRGNMRLERLCSTRHRPNHHHALALLNGTGRDPVVREYRCGTGGVWAEERVDGEAKLRRSGKGHQAIAARRASVAFKSVVWGRGRWRAAADEPQLHARVRGGVRR